MTYKARVTGYVTGTVTIDIPDYLENDFDEIADRIDYKICNVADSVDWDFDNVECGEFFDIERDYD